MKPIIGITTCSEKRPRKPYASVSRNYIDSVLQAGGLPVMIPSTGDKEALDGYINLIDGLLLSGGDDVHPLLYGENPINENGEVDVDRDECELSLYRMAYEIDMPVLGICRGIQVMNVAAGGTLYQDINAQHSGSLGHDPHGTPVSTPYHMVHIEEDSRLFEIFQSDKFAVNSFHHQAVKAVGNGYRVTALSADGIIEGIQASAKRFIIGVQWHPEDLAFKHPEFLRLFSAFVREASDFGNGR